MHNITEILNTAEKKYNKEFIYEKIDGKYQSITYSNFVKKAKSFANYCNNNGLKGKKILLFGKNSINLMIADAAITGYLGVCVNINAETKLEELEHIISCYNISAICYSSDEIETVKKLKNIKIINIDSVIPKLEVSDTDLKQRNENCIKIVFSSGTTSKPKGVMLSSKNMFAGWEPLQMRTKFDSNDKIYLCLPLNHTYANIYNFYYAFLSGLSIYLSSGFKNIELELSEVNPTIFCGVPFIFGKLSEIKSFPQVFGSKIKYLYSGGAKLDPELHKKYLDNNLLLLNAYALTVTASSFAIQYPDDIDFDSSGTIFENINVKIDKSPGKIYGRILIKGDCVFLGYANNELLTQISFTNDGYFITGDLGYIKDNKIYLMKREKHILITSNGENIPVDEIENYFSKENIAVICSIRNDKLYFTFYTRNKEKLMKTIERYNNSVIKQQQVKNFEIIIGEKKEKLIN